MLSNEELNRVLSLYEHESFFVSSIESFSVDEMNFEQMIAAEPLFYDIQSHFKQSIDIKPWENRGDYIPVILNEWKKIRDLLKGKFRERNIVPYEDDVKKSITYFIVVLHWLNQVPVQRLKELQIVIAQFQLKPVNCVERLLFILQKPLQYHSFIQLEQLFIELEKLFHKDLIKKNT